MTFIGITLIYLFAIWLINRVNNKQKQEEVISSYVLGVVKGHDAGRRGDSVEELLGEMGIEVEMSKGEE